MALFNVANVGIPLNMNAGVNFDSTRGDVLVTALPPVRDAQHTATSVTKSRLRLRWRHLGEWQSFENDATHYFMNVVTPADLAEMILNRSGMQTLWTAVNDVEVRTEAQIKLCVITYVKEIHNIAARGAQNAPLPSDFHASFVSVDSGVGNYGLVGVSDFAMFNDGEMRISAVGEVKNPWNVTPQDIDEVIDGSPSLPNGSANHNRYCPSDRDTFWTPCCRAIIRLYGSECQGLWRAHHVAGLVFRFSQ